MEPRTLLVLDLDETLVHSTFRPLDRPAEVVLFEEIHVYPRPHLQPFLKGVARDFELAVWSAGSSDYVQAAVEQILPEGVELVFCWGRDRCTPRIDRDTGDPCFLKNARKLRRRGYDLRRLLIVDDEPNKLRNNYGNAIYVDPYYGDPEDEELHLLLPYLRTLRAVDDVRRVEKREWRSRTTGG